MVAYVNSTAGPFPPIAVNLKAEFRRFTVNSVQLRRLYSETLKALDDISSSGVIPRESVKNLDLRVQDVQRQRCCVGKPPCVIILGQTCRVKAIIVNELFGRAHLPILGSAESLSWRMVRFKYSKKSQVLLTLGTSYELVEDLPDNHWKSLSAEIRNADLVAPDTETDGSVDDCAVVEMQLDHPLLFDNTQVVVPPTRNRENFSQIAKSIFDGTTPVVLYGISGEILSSDDISILQTLRSLCPTLPIFFVHMSTSGDTMNLTEVDRNEVLNHGTLNFTSENERKKSTTTSNKSPPSCSSEILSQLSQLGLISGSSTTRNKEKTSKLISNFTAKGTFWLEPEKSFNNFHVSSEYIQCLDELSKLSAFVRCYLQSQLIVAATHLHQIHSSCLQMFIMSAFDMAREMQITPRRLEYARMKEAELFENLMRIAEKKQGEMCSLIAETIAERREDILLKAELHTFRDHTVSENSGMLSGKAVKQCMDEIRDLVVLDLNNIIAQKLISSVYCLHDTFLGTLERCIRSLEKNIRDVEDGNSLASVALKQILTAAYQVEVSNHHSSSLLRGLFDKMKQLVHYLPWATVPAVDEQWRRLVAGDMLDSLCQSRLAKVVCAQLRERLRSAHDSFGNALRNLEAHHNERLEKTEEQGFRLRKVHAPRLARLALETSSIIDCLLYWMPKCGKEIGRGQYGVVFACESWGGHTTPLALKSVVPMDDKHWNDLAMEFYYMRSIPEHERIVRVRGSVIDHSYGGGTMPAVLIVMDRLSRDLYCALKLGLSWIARLQVALDVVAGIRYLHSQGLVHRDIKLKNILLDSSNRAKLTDLGFCKPEAMMSGSIVGTPIHMAPELFSGQYDSSVDVYAFGILFWYLCSGKVKLPQAFEQCQNKEHLWTSVKKGTRPERLPYFDAECWNLMESCWAKEPSERPLLGVVEPALKSIMERFKKIESESRDYSLSERSTQDTFITEVASDIEHGSPYLNIEYGAMDNCSN